MISEQDQDVSQICENSTAITCRFRTAVERDNVLERLRKCTGHASATATNFEDPSSRDAIQARMRNRSISSAAFAPAVSDSNVSNA
jgi:hypothetical protein